MFEIIDIEIIQSLMDDFYKLTHFPICLSDIKRNILITAEEQDICTKFHKVHPEASKHCAESYTKLTSSILPEEIKLYKCKNNLWNIAIPIVMGDHHIGYIFSGQFFFDDEPLDNELFRSQARNYGFNEEEYITALKKVPRLNREAVDTGISFVRKLANLLSQQSYSNKKLTNSMSEHSTLLEILSENEEKFRNIVEIANEGIVLLDAEFKITYANRKNLEIFGQTHEETIGKSVIDFMPEDVKPIIRNNFEKRRRGANGSYEMKLIRKDGSPFWAHINSKSLFKDGDFRGILLMFTDITERKKAEDKLRESEEKYRNIVETSNEGISLNNGKGIITYVNKKMADMLGYTIDEVIGRNMLDFVDTAYESIAHMNTQEKSLDNIESYDFKLICKDGSPLWVFINSKPIFDDNVKFIGSLNMYTDITERKKAEIKLKETLDNLENLVKERTSELETAFNSLRESEKGLSEAQRMAHIGNWEWDIATNKAYWSDEVYRIFGLSPQELALSHNEYLSYVHPDDRDCVIDACNEATNGKDYSIDHRIILTSGEERTIHKRSEVVFNEENTPVRIKGIIQDITERKKSEEKIRNLANIVGSSSDAIMALSLEGNITTWNKGAEQVYGYSQEEILGRSISLLAPSNLSDETKGLCEQIKQGENINNFETLRLRKDGKIINVSLTLSPVYDLHGKLTLFSIIGRDITKRVEAEKALAEIEIARKQEIHHRIKNNLQVISSLLDLQAEKFNNREYIKYSDVLNAFRDSQDRVISMALIHEELYKGGGFETLNFSQYAEELAENLLHTYSIGNTDISLKLDLVDNAFFDMDTATPLGIIVNELVSNAIKHAFQGRDKGEIQIKLKREEIGSYLKSINQNFKSTAFELTVSDNGIGIPVNLDIEELDSLGLQLVTSLVDQLDGKLEIKRNNGVEFTIRFVVKEKNNLASRTTNSKVNWIK